MINDYKTTGRSCYLSAAKKIKEKRFTKMSTIATTEEEEEEEEESPLE